MRVLDIGCGPGYVAGWLAGVQYVGLDTDEGYIKYARQRFGDRGEFSCELMTDEYIDRNEAFDYVIMTGVLHHLDDEIYRNVMRLSYRALKPGGVLVTLDGYYADQMNPVAKFFLDQDRGRHIRRVPEYLKLAGEQFSNIRHYDHPDYFRIPYTTLVMECSRPLV